MSANTATITTTPTVTPDQLWAVYHTAHGSMEKAGGMHSPYHNDLFQVGIALADEDYEQASSLSLQLACRIGNHGPRSFWMAECDRILMNLHRLAKLV